jgi:hypothetical protein
LAVAANCCKSADAAEQEISDEFATVRHLNFSLPSLGVGCENSACNGCVFFRFLGTHEANCCSDDPFDAESPPQPVLNSVLVKPTGRKWLDGDYGLWALGHNLKHGFSGRVHVEADFVDGNSKNFAVVIATDKHLQPIGSVAGSSWYKPCFPDEGEVSVKVFDAPVFYRERISPTAVKQAKLCPSVFELLDLLANDRRVAQSRADESQPNACPLLSDLKGLQKRWITWTEDGG